MAFRWWKGGFPKFPYTNFHEANLDYFLSVFSEIWTEWDELYTTLTEWKEQSDTDFQTWKTGVETSLNDWKTNFEYRNTVWQNATEINISEWKNAVLRDLDSWKESFIESYNDIEERVESIVSDTEEMIENLAEPFSTSVAYSAGDYVVYSGVLYVFTANHAAGAWTGNDAVQTTAMDDVTNLKNALENYTGVITINNWESGGYYETEEGTTIININQYVESLNYVHMAYACEAGTVFHLTSTGANHARNWAFIDSLGNIISRSNRNDYDFVNRKITAPENTAYAIFNARIANNYLLTSGNYVPEILIEINTKTQIYKGTASPTNYSNLMSHIVTPGTYYIQSSSNATYNDRPVNAPANSAGILNVEMYGSALVYQTYYGGKGNILHRLINTTTFNPYTTSIECDTYGWFIQTELTKINNAFRWNGKQIVCFGDSRTWYNGKTYGNKTKSEWIGNTCIGYQQQIKLLCGMSTINEGVSGETSEEICTRIRAYNFTGIDAVLLEGGVNDFVSSSSVTIGEIAPIGSTFDTTTIYGAWQSAIEYILTNYPDVKIYIDIPAIAWIGSGDTVFPYDVAKIKGEIAELYNIPCLNLYKDSGINILNRNYYFVDDITLTNNWHLHFNDYGNALIGAIIAEFINTH